MSAFEQSFSKGDLEKLFSVNLNTGELLWKERDIYTFKTVGAGKSWNLKYSNKPAGHTRKADGYREVGFKGRLTLIHRIVWCLNYGEWPQGQIDHIDGNPSNNSLINLRLATNQENCKNQKVRITNKSGVTGVRLHSNNKYVAYIKNLFGDQEHLGYFFSLEKAIQARKQKEEEYGYHINHGRVIT